LDARCDKNQLFDAIVDEVRPRLRVIVRHNARACDRQDLEQEILLALWRSLDRYEGRSSRRSWFYSVANNAVRDFARRNHRQTRLFVDAVAEEPAPYVHWQNRNPESLVEEFTGMLAHLDRMVFLMYLDDAGFEEMSAALEIPVEVLRVKTSRLKKLFMSRCVGS